MSVTVELRVAPAEVRGWHVELALALRERAGTGVTVRWVEDAAPWDRSLDRLFALERRLDGLAAGRSARVPAGDLAAVADAAAGRLVGSVGATGPADGSSAGSGPACLVLDLADGEPGPAPGSWHVEHDGGRGLGAAVRALLAGRFPVVTVRDGEGHPVASGRPGSEVPGVTVRALDDLLAGVVTLVVAAVTGTGPRLPASDLPAPPGGVPRSAAQRRRRVLADNVVRRAYRSLYRSPHWRVGWRFVDGPGALEEALASGALPRTTWHELADDGRHFYADPFPLEHAGRTHLFVEDFDHRLGRGVISVVEIGPSGPVGSPRPVLEHAVHLSYPCVLRDGGETWMVPETSAAGTVELYRAVSYPDEWVLEEVLIDGVVAGDATPFRHQGRWWLAASVATGGSCSDALHLWHAPALRGPWTPHQANPVVVDIASARPAGRVVEVGGRLLRTAQDGTGGYGAGLAVAEVVRLDTAGFEQRVRTWLRPDGSWPGTRLHTLNRAGRLEVVDGSARSPRLPLLP